MRLLFLLFAACLAPQGFSQTLYLQPFGGVNPSTLQLLRDSLENFPGIQSIVIAASRPHPALQPKPLARKAESYLNAIDSLGPRPYYIPWHLTPNAIVLGITETDITTASHPHQSWGVLGMGRAPGQAAIVSTFFLAGEPDSLWRLRLTRIARHELAHTLGLKHCRQSYCLMSEYTGTLADIDNSLFFCEKCKKLLFNHHK